MKLLHVSSPHGRFQCRNRGPDSCIFRDDSGVHVYAANAVEPGAKRYARGHTAGHVHIYQKYGCWNAATLQLPLVTLKLNLPISEKCMLVTICNGRNATSGANRPPEFPRHHLQVSTAGVPVQPQLVKTSLARPTKLGPPVV